MHQELKWGYQMPYLVTGILNKHPRSGMAFMKDQNGMTLGDFYAKMVSEEGAD